MKLTKIVATIGPSSKDPKVLQALFAAGMNVARLNFSHGTYEDHADLIKNIRVAAAKSKTQVGLLQDLQGPRMRLGVLPTEGFVLENKTTWILTNLTLEKIQDAKRKGNYLPVKFPQLAKTVKPGENILIADGAYELIVTKILGEEVQTTVKRGGKVTSNKGLNFPMSKVDVPVITDKDKADLKFGLEQGVDYIALSFVKNAANVTELKKLIAKQQPDPDKQPRVVVKIERPEALENLEELVMATDVVMVARGDLGIEIPAAQVPIEQKKIISLCIDHGKTVIIATQMLESMIKSPLATRAEVSDVANAVWDLTDAVMLSGETANGQYPVEAVTTMTDVASRCEEYTQEVHNCAVTENTTMGLGFAAAVKIADHVQSRFILLTNRDEKVRQLSAYRRSAPIIVVSSNPKMVGWASVIRGVEQVVLVSAKQLKDFAQAAKSPVKEIEGVHDIIIVGNEDNIKISIHR